MLPVANRTEPHTEESRKALLCESSRESRIAFTSAAFGMATSVARSFFSPRFQAAISSSPVRISFPMSRFISNDSSCLAIRLSGAKSMLLRSFLALPATQVANKCEVTLATSAATLSG